MAETLRLRLALASYKVHTDQADVPLERLRVQPVTGNSLPAGLGRRQQQPAHDPSSANGVRGASVPASACASEPSSAGRDGSDSSNRRRRTPLPGAPRVRGRSSEGVERAEREGEETAAAATQPARHAAGEGARGVGWGGVWAERERERQLRRQSQRDEEGSNGLGHGKAGETGTPGPVREGDSVQRDSDVLTRQEIVIVDDDGGDEDDSSSGAASRLLSLAKS